MQVKKLSYKTALYIPTEYGNDTQIPQYKIDNLIDMSLKRLIKIGGGATVIDGTGYWHKDNEDEVGKMQTKLIMCYVEDIEEGISTLKELAQWIKKETFSEAVCFEINNSLYIL